jgi:hypothetical protein
MRLGFGEEWEEDVVVGL